MRFLTCLLLASVFAVPAFAQQDNDMRALMGRMDQLQRQMDTVSRQVYNGNPPPAATSGGAASGGDNASLAAAMDERMSGLEGSMKDINNRLDQEDYAVGQLKSQFELYKNDMEIRMKEMETHSASASPVAEKTAIDATKKPDTDEAPAGAGTLGSPAKADAVAADTSTDAAGEAQELPTDNAASLYDASFQALREQKYDRAEKGFKEFLKRYSTDTLAGNSQYWLGETYYVRGNYTEAAKAFAIGYQKYPKSTKAPDNLLKLGLSLAQNKKTQDACVTLQQLGVQYKNAAAVIKQRAAEEMKTLKCVGASDAAQ